SAPGAPSVRRAVATGSAKTTAIKSSRGEAMNCRRIQELIPLFIEDDLDSRPEKLLLDHVRSCEVCRHLVDEFRQRQGWLKAAVPREFDAAYFENVESRVWAGIDDRGKPSAWDRITGRLWTVQLPIAVGALLVLVTGITFFFVRSLPERGQSNDGAVAQGRA